MCNKNMCFLFGIINRISGSCSNSIPKYFQKMYFGRRFSDSDHHAAYSYEKLARSKFYCSKYYFICYFVQAKRVQRASIAHSVKKKKNKIPVFVNFFYLDGYILYQ